MDVRFAPLFKTPYYAVIFTNLLASDAMGYREMSDQMVALAANQSGFLGVESMRDENGFGITVSYWKDEESIRSWKAQMDHKGAQKLGKSKWYRAYNLRVSKVERSYSGPAER